MPRQHTNPGSAAPIAKLAILLFSIVAASSFIFVLLTIAATGTLPGITH